MRLESADHHRADPTVPSRESGSKRHRPQSRRPNSPLPRRYGRKPGIAVFIGRHIFNRSFHNDVNARLIPFGERAAIKVMRPVLLRSKKQPTRNNADATRTLMRHTAAGGFPKDVEKTDAYSAGLWPFPAPARVGHGPPSTPRPSVWRCCSCQFNGRCCVISRINSTAAESRHAFCCSLVRYCSGC
jgi:hypothetical protein